MTNANLQFANPTETLDAIEQALQGLHMLTARKLEHAQSCRLRNLRDLPLREQQCNCNVYVCTSTVSQVLVHLATLKQQVAELVAFREAHEWRPTPDGGIKNGDRGIVGIWSNILNDWLYISDAVFCWDSEITKLAWRDSEGEALESDLSAGRATFYMPLTPPAADGGQGA